VVPRERVRVAAEQLTRMAEQESPDPAELAAVRAELLAAERELAGPRERAPRGAGGKAKILAYLKARVGQPVSGEELREASGIQEWARRVRELRVEDGYPIEENAGSYTLLSEQPDLEVAARWQLANEIRRRPGDARDRIADYFRANVGKVVPLEELHYVARIKEVPRRIRELRDEFGMRISSRHARPELRPDEYMLETLDPLPANERQIRAAVWAAVVERDNYRCVRCGAIPGDRGRWLEVDHIVEKVDGGSDDLDNLQTLCNVCHASKTAAFQRERRGS
jgi:biotin operon repressor